MMLRFGKVLTKVLGTTEEHGTGSRELSSAMVHRFKLMRLLRLVGLARRFSTPHHEKAAAMAVCDSAVLVPSMPVESVTLRVGVMIHMFYPDLIEEFAQAFAHMPLPYTLMVSVMDEEAKSAALRRFSSLPQLQQLHVRVVPNRGRNIAPMLLTFREEILAQDVLCHVHTKKSFHGGQEQSGWRRYLVESLFGSRQRLAWILSTFSAKPTLGIVYPESYATVPLACHTWLSNVDPAQELARRMGFDVDASSYLDFPAGSMFWARTNALRPLFNLSLTLDSFPAEQGQIDGTVQHALERMFGVIVRQQGMLIGILPSDGRQELYGEGERNRSRHFDTTLRGKIERAAAHAQLISLDLFDTVVLRAFLNPGGSRAYLAYQVKKLFGIEDFADLRARAEVQAHMQLDREPHIADIYTVLGSLTGLSAQKLVQLHQYELAFEHRQLRPRKALIDVLQAQLAGGKRLIGIADTHLSSDELRQILPKEVSDSLVRLYASSDIGMRKEMREAWLHLSHEEGVLPEHWLHVGDDEHVDMLRPALFGFIFPVHVLRPEALLSVVPALRSLRPSSAQNKRWEDQLWLGLLANHFTDISDLAPEHMAGDFVIETPETFGYTVLGPLIIDYLAWLARLALERGSKKLLFVSQLLHCIYASMRTVITELDQVEGVYRPLRREIAEQNATCLADWVAQIGAQERPILADITCSSRIQLQLSRLIGKPVGGAYFTLGDNAAPLAADDGWVAARFYDGSGAQLPSAVAQFHLLLESTLTSPEERLARFDAVAEDLQSVYRCESDEAKRSAIVERIHAGALRFAEDVIALAQGDTLHLNFDRHHVQEPLRCVGTQVWQLGSWASDLMAEGSREGLGKPSIYDGV